MFIAVRNLVKDCILEFENISAERKAILESLSLYIQEKYKAGKAIKLNFICTHNSRRSHLGQLSAAIAGHYYAIDDVHTYSGGTEATQLNANVINTLSLHGLQISNNDDLVNKTYTIRYGKNDFVNCFSKVYHHPVNPSHEFAAVMTCNDADEACPFIPGAEKRFSLTYEDPKKSDGSGQEAMIYGQRFKQILTEILYAFSRV